MSSVRINSGSLKGRHVPLPKKIFKDAEITPGRVKEAFFSIIGPVLNGKSFLDLFSCSGQMAFEAVSRGAEPVILNEIDKKKFLHLRYLIDLFNIKSRVSLHNRASIKLLKSLNGNNISVDILFIDSPYVKFKGAVDEYDEILKVVDGRSILNHNGILCVQHYKDNVLSDRIGRFRKIKIKNFGTNALSFYKDKTD